MRLTSDPVHSATGELFAGITVSRRMGNNLEIEPQAQCHVRRERGGVRHMNAPVHMIC